MADAPFVALFSNISDKLGNLGLSDIVPIFGGDSSQFKSWIKAIEKSSVINGLDDAKKKIIAYRFSTGTVSDFINRNITESPETTWTELKLELTGRYGTVSDSHLKFSLLRNIRQRVGESVQNYAERVVTLASEAYENFDQGLDLIDHQLIGTYIEGLNDESIKFRLLRIAPTTFQDTVAAATREQNYQIRCRLHKDNRPIEHNTDRHNKPMLECNESMEIDHLRRGIFCQICKRSNHTSADCRHRRYHINEVRSNNNYYNYQPRTPQYNAKQWGHNYSTNTRLYNTRFYNDHNDRRQYNATPPREFTRERYTYRPKNFENSRQSYRSSNVQCYFCGRNGHIKRECTQFLQSIQPNHNNSNNSQNYSKNM